MAFKPDDNIAKALKQSNPNNNGTDNRNEQNTQNYSDLLNLVSKKNVEKEAISITILLTITLKNYLALLKIINKIITTSDEIFISSFLFNLIDNL